MLMFLQCLTYMFVSHHETKQLLWLIVVAMFRNWQGFHWRLRSPGPRSSLSFEYVKVMSVKADSMPLTAPSNFVVDQQLDLSRRCYSIDYRHNNRMNMGSYLQLRKLQWSFTGSDIYTVWF